MADALKDKFDDPVLKSAVCRCWASEIAPAELRACVLKLFRTDEESPDLKGSSRQGPLRFPRATWALAAAAIIVLALGLPVHYWLKGSHLSHPAPALALVSIPLTLQTDLIIRHDLCCQHADHQGLEVAENDDAAIAGALHTKLSRPVLVARPTDPGWTFRGAAICPVGIVPCGHLVFARGTDTLSIFSLPKSVAPTIKDGQEFAMSSNGHSIAGFGKAGTLFCLVCNSPGGTLTADQLQKMRTQMEADVTVARADSSSRIVIAELLRDRSQ